METTDQKPLQTNQDIQKQTTSVVDKAIAVEPLSPVKITPVIKIGLIVLGTLVLLLILSAIFIKKPTPTSSLIPTPLPSAMASVSAEPRPVSAFAQTDQFKDFETKLQKLRIDMDGVDLSEPQLAYPLIDTNVNFNK